MRRIILILFTMLCSCIYAQEGLHINKLFEGKIVPQEKMVETRIRGKAISKYKLSYFHSLRFQADEHIKSEIDELYRQDSIYAQSKRTRITDGFVSSALDQMKYSCKDKTTIYTRMLVLPPRKGLRCYLCYKMINDTMTVIYMEGTVSSLEELRKIFKE